MLEWNVWVGNFNTRQIEPYNIFDHGGFLEDCKKAARKYSKDRAAFLEEIHGSLMYYFWSKCEWEIVLNHWPPYSEEEAVKTDVYKQIMINWPRFADYVWNSAIELRRRT